MFELRFPRWLLLGGCWGITPPVGGGMWLPSHHLLFSSLHLLICLYLHPLVFALCLSLFSSVCCGWEWASSSVGAWLPVKANPGQGRRCYPTFHIQDKALNKYHWPVLERVKELCTLSTIQIRNHHTYSSVKTCFFFQSECPPWQSMNLQHLLQHELAAVVTAYWQNSSLGLAQPAALCLHLVFTPSTSVYTCYVWTGEGEWCPLDPPSHTKQKTNTLHHL